MTLSLNALPPRLPGPQFAPARGTGFAAGMGVPGLSRNDRLEIRFGVKDPKDDGASGGSKEILRAINDAMDAAEPEQAQRLQEGLQWIRAMLDGLALTDPARRANLDLVSALQFCDYGGIGAALAAGADPNYQTYHASAAPAERLKFLQLHPDFDPNRPDSRTGHYLPALVISHHNPEGLKGLLKDPRLDKTRPEFRNLLLDFPFDCNRNGRMWENFPEMLAILLAEPEMDLNAVHPRYGFSPLYSAAMARNDEALEMLLADSRLDRNRKIALGKFPPRTVAECIREEIAKRTSRKPKSVRAREHYERILAKLEG